MIIDSPIIPNATGAAQRSNAVVAGLIKWKITNIVALVFDTTASNTDCLKGASTLNEQWLAYAILWLACRHHVYEIHIKHVGDKVLGARGGPSDKLFVRFKDEFSALDKSIDNLVKLEWSTLSPALKTQAQSVLDWGQKVLEENTFPREDYRELIELTAIYLGGFVPRGFRLRKPGAHHTARFMAYALLRLENGADVRPF